MIYLRPGATRGGCLAAQGRMDAGAVGAAFGRHGIPVGSVLAAPDCASPQAARAAFRRAGTSRSVASISGLRRLLGELWGAESNTNKLVVFRDR